MKFKLKVTLAMLCLVSLLFGIGGSFLISISFNTTLQREKESAYGAYQMIFNTLQIVSDIDNRRLNNEIPNILEQLFSQRTVSLSALRLSAETETLYEDGVAAKYLDNITQNPDPGHYLVSSFTDTQNNHYLQISGTFSVGRDTMLLDAAYDISPIYRTREEQQSAYRIIFLLMVAACAVLTYTITGLLTRPLFRLTKASKEIASGNLSYRSNVYSNDEIGMLSSNFDRMADKVEQSIVEMQESVERQMQFMSSFSHELKTPMTSIIGYADLIRSQTLTPEEQREAASYIFSEGKRLESLSIKLLDIFVAGKRNIKLVPKAPSEIIANFTAHFKKILRQDGIVLQYKSEKGICFLEPDLVWSLLTNLMDNSKKALDQGGNIVILSKMTSDGCQIRVLDNGSGIPKEAIKHLTEAFYRVDKSRSRSQGGAGLGLSLCAEIAAIHNGSIRFGSQQGRGTCVIVELKGGRL